MKNKSGLIVLFCSIHFILGLDINTVSVSIPSISAYFKVTASEASRILWVYFVVLTSLLLTFGKIGDLKGFKKTYFWGVLIFTLGALFSTLSNDLNLLTACRVFQALGASILFALTPALISASFPKEKAGKIFGLNYVFTALGGIFGRTLSGYLIDWFTWRSVFAIVIPFAIIGIIMVMIFVKDQAIESNRKRFDFAGAISVFIFLFCLMYGINLLYDFGKRYILISILFAVASLSLISFIILEKKKLNNGTSLINWSLLKEKRLLSPLITFALIYIITNGMIYISPFFLQYGGGFSVQQVGLLMAIPSGFQMIAGYSGGKLSDAINIQRICFSATLILIISIIFFVIASVKLIDFIVVIALILYGIAIGFFIPANTNRIMSTTPLELKGSVSSLMTTTIRLGSAMGTALFAGTFSFIVPVSTNKLTEIPYETLMLGFKLTFLLSLLVAIVTSVSTYYSKDLTKKDPLNT